jgi:epoxyqueuosine reductase
MADIKKAVLSEIRKLGMDAVGIADAGIVNGDAPEGFRPANYLPEATSVIIIGMIMPAGSIRASAAGRDGDILFMRSFWNSAQILDTAAHRIAIMLEKRFGRRSIPLPTYSPMRLHNGIPKGILSLKHMARIAGLGGIGRNSLLINPKMGNRLRLSGVLTEAFLSPDRPFSGDPCPHGCSLCVKACPVNAIRDRSVDIITCMGRSIRHPLMQPYWSTRLLLWLSKKFNAMHGFVEDINNMMVTHYSEACTACMRACPYFK